MNYLKHLLLLLLYISVFNCETESTSTPGEEEQNDDTLVRKIIFDKDTANEFTDTFNYDGNKLMSVDYSDNAKNVYTYDDNDNIIKDEYFEDDILVASVEINYDVSNKIAEYTETFFEDSGLDDRQYKHVFSYGSDGTINDKTYVSFSNAEFELFSDITIVLDGKNITQISDKEETYIRSYTYDDKNNPFKNIHAIEVLNILSENEFGAIIEGNTNNVLIYSESGNSNFDFETTNTYTYNENNYPIEVSSKSVDGTFGEDTSTIEFFYE